LDSFIL